MSLSKFFILSALYRRSMHGYDIAKEVASISNGCCSPTEGTIYPVLRQYEEGGYVTSHEETVSGRVRKVYELTDKGRRAFRVAVEAWMDVTESLTDCKKLVQTQ
jgi:DNA-binding PadR family transcriptional regulator